MTTRRDFARAIAAGVLTVACSPRRTVPALTTPATLPGLDFDPAAFTLKEYSVNGRTISVRAYEGLATVQRPVEPRYQALNLYIPDAYFRSESIGRYSARTAPILLANTVGGYMPALPGRPDGRMGPPPQPGTVAPPSAMATALALGFVVAAPGARGRTLRDSNGRWTGKAPAAIVDLKAAVRWLRHNRTRIPGNVERIVSNGTSAGGALSALLGASGNSPDFDAELRAIGAAPERDDIFAVSAFCPITNLEHADAAYEWQFRGVDEYRPGMMPPAPGAGPGAPGQPPAAARLDGRQLALAVQLRAEFATYVNGLALSSPTGARLTVNPDGTGTLQQHVEALLMTSAQRAITAGADLRNLAWLTIEGSTVRNIDFSGYVRAIGRMKGLPAFDGLALEIGENQLFGDAQTDRRHFTAFAMEHGTTTGASRADALTVRQMNAMHYATDRAARVAAHWHIRHGTRDRDTALAIPVLLAAVLRTRGVAVDLALPWDRPHSGDYELDELFAWIDSAVDRG